MENIKSKYTFPNHYYWPFFYTIQKHAETRMKQLEMWATIVKEYCKANKIWKISKEFFLENIGKNTSINRKLSSEAANTIFEFMQNKLKMIFPAVKEYYFVLWKNVEEWQQCIYDSVIKHHRVDSLETLDYLMYDEEVANEEYFGIDKDLLVMLLKSLEQKGKCSLLQDDGVYMGVKFIKV